MTPVPAVWLDHAVVAIDALERGISVFEAMAGVRPVMGGAHPTLGTENAPVSLDHGRYLEILAPRPGGSLHPMVRDVGTHHTLTPFLWALATDDLARLRQQLSRAGFASEELAREFVISLGARYTKRAEQLFAREDIKRMTETELRYRGLHRRSARAGTGKR